MQKQKIKFGTDGWRAIIAEDFTFENVTLATKAIGSFLMKNHSKENPIIIGYDCRFMARDFAELCANELLKLGLNVNLSNTYTPTPIIAFYAAKSKTSGGIQFTASHNPPKYCGLKVITSDGGPATEETTNEITKCLTNPDGIKDFPKGKIKNFNPTQEYFSHIQNLIDCNKIKEAKLKVVYDPLFGAGNGYLDYLLKEAGCEVTIIHNKLDPLFGGLLPEPREENLAELKAVVISHKASLGIGTDGDADRLSIVDENGIFYSPNKIASMLLRHLYKNKKLKGKVVRTLSTTHLMDKLAEKYNLEIVETKVGFKWIYKEMMKSDVLIGAEESGGITILNHIPDKDAILAGMLLVEMLAYESKSISEIYKDTLKDADWYCINDKFDFHLKEEQKEVFLNKLSSGDLKQIGSLNVISFNDSEGAKYLLEDGSWFLARASGTEPMARVYFEATSDKVLEEMKKTVTNLLK